MITITVNNKNYELDSDPSMPLLWVLRDILGLTGTKFGCGIAQCGACSIHINDRVAKSCITPIISVVGQRITTIEGLSDNVSKNVHSAWLIEDVAQCGYCQPGQIMCATALLYEKPEPSNDDINKAMAGNICRCGTYQRIKKAIHHASELQKGELK